MNFSFFLGGIILFIYSIDILSNDLLLLSKEKIRTKLSVFTSSLHSSLLTGFISTSLIQSSSALIMLTIALINADLLTFNQSLGIVLGSNIATTLTSFITGLNLEKYASFIMIFSSFFAFNKKSKIQKVAKICFSIGLLLFSIYLMSYGTQNIKENPLIYTYIKKVTNSYFLSLIIGILLTTALQSSSVFITIIQILALSGFINLYQAIPLILGANIGTSFDPLLSYFSLNKEGKKLAHFSIFFNIITVLIFTIFITPFTFIVEKTCLIFNANIAINIALINIIFNIFGVLITLPFLNKIKRYYAKW